MRRPVRGVADVDVGDDAGPAGIAGPDGVGEVAGAVGADEVHGAAGPARAESLPPRKPGDSSAEAIRASSAGELFPKSSRLEACEADIGPEGRDIPAPQGLGPPHDPLILRQDVPRPQAADGIEIVPDAPTRRASRREGGGRLRPPCAPGSGRRPARTPPGDGCTSRRPAAARSSSRRRRSPAPGLPTAALVFQGPAVEDEGVPRPSEEDRELVEQARGDADELVLRPPQDLGQVHPGRRRRGRPTAPDSPAAGAGTSRRRPASWPSWTAPRPAARRPRSPRRTRRPAAPSPPAMAQATPRT